MDWQRKVTVNAEHVNAYLNMNTDILKNKFVGCMLGTHIGDALGMPVEGCDHRAIEADFGEFGELRECSIPGGG